MLGLLYNVVHKQAMTINFQARVAPWVRTWWVSFCQKEGYLYKGKPHFSRLLEDIAKGEWELKKKSANEVDD